MSKGRKVTSIEQRLAWLKRHPSLWEDAKLVAIQGGDYRLFLSAEDHRRIAQAMKDAKLFSPLTYVRDIPVHKYVRILRGLR
jgi:hypothetical protein